MKHSDVQELGFPEGKIAQKAFGWAISQMKAKTYNAQEALGVLLLVALRPELTDIQSDDPELLELANMLINQDEPFKEREEPAPWKQWGDDIEAEAVEQLVNAVRLPVSVKGALMPDGHKGYGIPIGGVLATRNAVIPYAVGVDIACRVKMSILPLMDTAFAETEEHFIKAIEAETRFGMGASFDGSDRRSHAVLDEGIWNTTDLLKSQKDKAWNQLGSSGGGNHFVDIGELEIDENSDLGIPVGKYLAVFTHSGSRGPGARIADYYSKLAMAEHPELPEELKHLAWLDLDSEAGQEYWAAMELMGRFASANHECMHDHICAHLGVEPMLQIENHHNFAWKEKVGGEDVIVHRKGATPAGKGVLGIIPGSMATPAYIVRGLGSEASMNSAAHGAGRRMSRKKAKALFNWSDTKTMLAERRVRLISGGLDETPGSYKNIDEVMANQSDLVTPVAKFEPRLVKMAPPQEKPWERKKKAV